MYRASKGNEDSASEAIRMGDLSAELLEGLEVDIKENNANDDVGEIVLDRRQNLSNSEEERLDFLILGHFWNLGLGKNNPALSRLKNRYRKSDISREEAECWEIMTGKPYPPEHRVVHTVEEIRWAKNVIASISDCSEVEYALRLIMLYERWLYPASNRCGFTKREMFLYFRRCLAWTGSDYSDERTRSLLNALNQKPWELIRLQDEEDSTSEEPYYELTEIGRIRAAGSLESLPFQSIGNIEKAVPSASSGSSMVVGSGADATSVIVDKRFTDTIEEPPEMYYAAKVSPSEPHEAVLVEVAPDVSENVREVVTSPIVKALEKQTNEIKKQAAILEKMGESTGRHTAKWLLKVDLVKTNRDLQEEILSDMGFEPVEVVEKLYPNANDGERKKNRQRISKNNIKRNKTS